MTGPSYTCGTIGCCGLAWSEGGECARCRRRRIADNARNPVSIRDEINRRRAAEGGRPLGELDPDLYDRARAEGYDVPTTKQEG